MRRINWNVWGPRTFALFLILVHLAVLSLVLWAWSRGFDQLQFIVEVFLVSSIIAQAAAWFLHKQVVAWKFVDYFWISASVIAVSYAVFDLDAKGIDRSYAEASQEVNPATRQMKDKLTMFVSLVCREEKSGFSKDPKLDSWVVYETTLCQRFVANRATLIGATDDNERRTSLEWFTANFDEIASYSTQQDVIQDLRFALLQLHRAFDAVSNAALKREGVSKDGLIAWLSRFGMNSAHVLLAVFGALRLARTPAEIQQALDRTETPDIEATTVQNRLLH